MKINSVTTNYNQPKQVTHKGALVLVNPNGTSQEIHPRGISRLKTEFFRYYATWRGKNSNNTLCHCIEVTKAIFDNSQFFYVNAKKDDVEQAIQKAIELPSGKKYTVGEPLLYYLKSINDPSTKMLYKDIKNEDAMSYMEKSPNTVYLEETYVRNDVSYINSNLAGQFESEGSSMGSCSTSLADQIIDWTKKEEPENAEES